MTCTSKLHLDKIDMPVDAFFSDFVECICIHLKHQGFYNENPLIYLKAHLIIICL